MNDSACSNDSAYFYWGDAVFGGRTIRKLPRPKLKKGQKFTPFGPVKPRTHYYHYSNPDSQGALICQTENFPDGFISPDETVATAYSDRIFQWDSKRHESACKIAGGGDQAWAFRLPSLGDDGLREFAKVALNLDVKPRHVRVVHYYNVSSGHSCPVVLAIVDAKPEKKA